MTMEYCSECGNPCSSRAKTCPHCGVGHGPRLSRQVRIGLLAFLPVILFIGYGLLRYGTASPCGMLKNDMIAQLAKEPDEFGILGLILANPLIESYLESKGPVECLVALGKSSMPALPGGESQADLQSGPFDSVAKADLRMAMAAQEIYWARRQTYSPDALKEGSYTASPGVTISTSAASVSGYSVTASHGISSNTFYVEVGTGGSMEGKVRAIAGDEVFDLGLGRDEDFFGPSLIGQTAPAWYLETLEGDSLSLDDLQGKVVILNFWASWYASQEAEHTVLIRAAAAWPEEDVQVVGVIYQDSRRNVQRFLDQHGDEWQHVMDPMSRTATRYGVYGPPTTFFVGRNGIVGMKHIGPLTWSTVTTNVDLLLATGANPRR